MIYHVLAALRSRGNYNDDYYCNYCFSYKYLCNEKLKKNDVKNIEKEIKETDRIKNILAGLKQCDCELIVKETMFLIDVPYSVEGKIIDLDDDWVLIVSMGRKTISRMIRITMIKDVIELTK